MPSGDENLKPPAQAPTSPEDNGALGVGPYRATVPLSKLIPPDRRWLRTLAAGVLGAGLGAFAYHAGSLYAARGAALSSSEKRIGPVTLHGPAGAVTLPMKTPAVVNVWLQGCSDCAPAFDAAIALKARGGLKVDVPIVNVAYGEADPQWAEARGLAQNLVFDPKGDLIVNPLGIGTFTTVVLDENGVVRLIDYPHARGFADRVAGATAALAHGSARTRPPLPTGDPLDGRFTLEQATRGLAGGEADSLIATIETTKGPIVCNLLDDKAPVTVANFIGLATGKRTWKDPNTGEWTNRPAYDGTTFHRVIRGFMIQGGDPKGDGTGEPGYMIPDEMWEGGTHARSGLLCMANAGANTNGAQFFITDSDGPAVKNLDHLRSYTIFGQCRPMDTIHAIAGVETGPTDRPTVPVTIKSVRIARGAGLPQ